MISQRSQDVNEKSWQIFFKDRSLITFADQQFIAIVNDTKLWLYAFIDC